MSKHLTRADTVKVRLTERLQARGREGKVITDRNSSTDPWLIVKQTMHRGRKNVKKLEAWNTELKQMVVNLVEELHSGNGEPARCQN